MQDFGIGEYDRRRPRVCSECGRQYTINEFLESSEHYFPKPCEYRSGCESNCLACWLDVGPSKSPDDEDVIQVASPPESDQDWPYEQVRDAVADGDVLRALKWFTDRGHPLMVLPVSRLRVEYPIAFPGGFLFYPPGGVNLDALNPIDNREDTGSLAEYASFAAGANRDILESHPLALCPMALDASRLARSSHATHLHVIRRVSEQVDRNCLDFIRYNLCRIGLVADLPGRAGQTDADPMMSGLLAYDPKSGTARIFGGAAFTHSITTGVGLDLEELRWETFPKRGEVGRVVQHALGLYTAMLEANSETHRFVQAMSLLEFLVGPTEYTSSEMIRKVVARHSAKDRVEYAAILERLDQIGGKKDKLRDVHTGYRTRVVHIGHRIEQIIPGAKNRRAFFLELDGYVRAVVDHMIVHSEKSWACYETERAKLKPYDV